MSGMNKNSNLNRLLKIGSTLYVLALIVFLLILLSFSKIYETYQGNRVSKIKNSITKIIEINDINIQKQKLIELTQKNPIQIVVLNKQETIYSNSISSDFSQISKMVRDDVILYESAYKQKSKDIDYQIYLLVYDKMSSEMLNILFIFFIVSIIILCIGLAYSVRNMFGRLVYPLERLKDNINKLKDYRLHEVEMINQETEYDILSYELSSFTKNLKEKLDDVEITYTSLEKQLRANEQMNIYKTQLISTLIHDVKTPLNIIKLSNYKMNKLKIFDQIEADEIDKKSDTVISSINEVLQIMYSNDFKLDEIESICVYDAIKDVLRLLNDLFSEKNLSSNLEVQNNVYIDINKVEFKSIIHNALINIYHYAKEYSEFNIETIIIDNKLVIEFKNEVEDIDTIDFNNVFNLFYTSQKRGTDGSGVGMYIIKNLVERYDGKVIFKKVNDSVSLQIYLPIKESVLID